jgi:hypothetical protein
MYIARIIPEGVLDRVRCGARGALLEPLAALRTLAEHDPERAHGKYTSGLLVPINRLVRLLDVIGWSAGDVMPEATIDIEEDGPARCRRRRAHPA